MSEEQMIAVLRKYMSEYDLPWKVHAALAWCIAKLYKEMYKCTG